MKNLVSEMEYSLEGLTSRGKLAEDGINELDDEVQKTSKQQ